MKAGRGTTTQQHHAGQDGRARILEAAIRSFADEGYAGTTTAGVARAAGVAQPLVHHYFGSKEGMWRAAMDHLFADVEPILAAVDTHPSPTESLTIAIDGFVRLSAARPEILRVIAREGGAPSPRLTYLLERYVRPAMERAVAAIREAQRAGTVSRELRPELLLFFVVGGVSHLFDVPVLAREALGIDVAEGETRDAFAGVVREVLRSGALREKEKR